jgi:hypothetical protein
MSNRSGGSSLFGSAYTYGAGNATVEATAFGNFTTAYAYASGNNHAFQNFGSGSFMAGYSQGPGVCTAQITPQGAGAFMVVRPQATQATATATAIASQAGAFVQGSIVANRPGLTNSMSATGRGAFAQGRVEGLIGGAAASIVASGEGSFAQGQAFGHDILASGNGALAQGLAAINDITASGSGSLARGDATAGNILASATNSIQFGPGTNSLADSLQIGNAGIRIKGTAGAPGTMQDGDIWFASGSVYVRTGGVTKNLDAV